MSIRLELTDPTGAVRTMSFERGPVNVGRARNADVRVEGDAISRIHAVLEGGSAGWTINHRGSALPTMMNGAPLPMGSPVPLSNGDIAEIGETRITVHVEVGMDSAPPTFIGGDSFATAEPLMSIPPPFVAPGPSGQDVPTLLATMPGGDTLRLELHETGRDYVIGRADVCDLSLEDSSCSRQHAIVRTDGTRVFLRDAGARNPVRLNNRPIVGETPVQPGDMLQLGSTEIQFIGTGVAGSSPVAPAPFAPPPVAPPPVAPPPVAPPPVAAAPPQPVAPPPPPPPVSPPGGDGGWDAIVGGGAPAPGWQPDASAPAPAPPPPPPAPAAPAAGDWAAQVRQPPAARKSDKPAWDVPAPPPKKAPPPKLDWHDGGSGGAAAGAGPSWDGPPPVAPGGAPPAAPAPAPPPPPPPPPPPSGGAPGGAAGEAPPDAAAAAAAEEADLGKEPKVVTRRGSSQKGWLIAGAICMFLAVALGFGFIVAVIS